MSTVLNDHKREQMRQRRATFGDTCLPISIRNAMAIEAEAVAAPAPAPSASRPAPSVGPIFLLRIPINEPRGQQFPDHPFLPQEGTPLLNLKEAQQQQPLHLLPLSHQRLDLKMELLYSNM